jgi:hypothetical protein
MGRCSFVVSWAARISSAYGTLGMTVGAVLPVDSPPRAAHPG